MALAVMTARDLLQRQRDFIARQGSGRDFLLQLCPLLDALGRAEELQRQLDALRCEAEAHRAAIATYDSEAGRRLVALGNDVRTMFPSPDPPSTSDDPVRPWYWARFDSIARGSLELRDFALPDDQSDPTVAGKLLPFLRGKLQDILNQVERSGDETPLERSAPLWDRYNEEERQHEYAVRDFHVAAASHAGWSLRRIEYVANLLTRRPTAADVEASGGLDFTPWEPVTRAVNFAVFGTKPREALHFNYERESTELVAVLRKDVDRLCQELDLRLMTTNHATGNRGAQVSAAATTGTVAPTSGGNSDGAPFEEASWETVDNLLPVDALLMTAVPVELRSMRSRLLPPPSFTRLLRIHWQESTYYLGRIGAYTCAVAMSAPGAIARAGAILTLHDAVGRLRPSFTLAVGIAFGKDPSKQSIGDVLVSTQVIPYEHERLQPTGDLHRAPRPEAGMVLLDRLRMLESEDSLAVKMHFGPLLSGEKLVDDAERKAGLFAKHPTAIGGEMEAAGIYAAAERNRLEWAVVKAICDWGDGKKNDDHQELAARNASHVVETLLWRGGLERAMFSPNDRTPSRLAGDEMPEIEVSTTPFFRSPRPGRGRRGG